MSSDESGSESDHSDIPDINYNEDRAYAEMTQPEYEKLRKESDERLTRKLEEICNRYEFAEDLRCAELEPKGEGLTVTVDRRVMDLPTVKVVTQVDSWSNRLKYYVSPTEVMQLILKNLDGSYLTARQVNQLRDRSEDDLFKYGEIQISGTKSENNSLRTG